MADNYEIDVTLDQIFGTGISSVEQTVESHEPNGVNEITVTLTNGQTSVFNVRNGDSSGKPTPVATEAEMTDTSEIYLYTGNEEGYVKGNIYCYEGGEWTDVGTYGGMVVDEALDANSDNAVANKTITSAIQTLNNKVNSKPGIASGGNKTVIIGQVDQDPPSGVSVPTVGLTGALSSLITTNKNSLTGAINEVKADVNALIAAVGSPLVASTVAGMTDQTKIYVYTGSETGYTSGHWYYYNGSAWADGGIYQSTGIDTDKTLTVADQAADGKAVGDELTALNSALNSLTEGGEVRTSIVPTIVENVAIGNTGQESPTDAYNATDYIEIPSDASSVSTNSSFSASLGSAFYDSSKNFISGVTGENVDDYGGTDTSEPQTIIIPVPVGAKYFRSCMRTYYYTQPSDYDITFIAVKDSLYNLIEEAEQKIEANESEIDNIASNSSKNLCNESNNVNGCIQSDGSISMTGAFANYVTSEFIEIKPSTNYVYSIYASSGNVGDGRKFYLLYDANKNVIANSYVNQTGVTELLINNSLAHYIRLSASNVSSLMLEKGSTRTEYSAYKVEFKLNDSFSLTATMKSELTDSLNGKKWIPLGDSFTDYTNKTFSDGTYKNKYASYPRLISLRTGIEIDQDFFLSGRTMAYPSDGSFTNSITCPTADCYYQNIPADADYVTIMLGINDCQHTGSGTTGDGEDATGVITLGTIDDTTTATYFGAYNTVLEWLRTNRPFAHVGIIVTNGTTRQDYTEAQIALAKKWGYPYLNLNGDERTPAFIRCYNPNISNSLKDLIKQKQAVDYNGQSTGSVNTHPNWQTHELESHIIETWLRGI